MDINLNALGDALAPYARSVTSSLPGGSTVLDVVNRYNASNRATPTNRAAPAATTAAVRPAAAWYTKPLVLAGAGLAVVGLVVLLVFRRR